jgi:hypothetical protein
MFLCCSQVWVQPLVKRLVCGSGGFLASLDQAGDIVRRGSWGILLYIESKLDDFADRPPGQVDEEVRSGRGRRREKKGLQMNVYSVIADVTDLLST